MPLQFSPQETLYDLVIWLLPGLTTHKLSQLTQEFGDKPEHLLKAASQLSGLKARTRDLIHLALHDPWRLPFAQQLEEHLRWAEAEEHWLLPWRAFPQLLQEIADPPLLLAVKGQPSSLQGPSLAIVGSRRLSPEGRSLAYEWSHWLAWQGLNLVSGLARGVDGQAHLGAVQAIQEGASGGTLAVLAQGLDSVYPPEHQGLADQLVELGGALVSEYPLGHLPLARQFPRRNRIITGLALGTLVVEATPASGSLVSARLAMEQGREVMAIPGSVRRQQSQGCHQLIRQGAALVTSPEEVLQEIQLPLSFHLQTQKQDDEHPIDAKLRPVYQVLSDVPLSLDEILLQSQLDAASGLRLLQELELTGWVEQQPGGWCRST